MEGACHFCAVCFLGCYGDQKLDRKSKIVKSDSRREEWADGLKADLGPAVIQKEQVWASGQCREVKGCEAERGESGPWRLTCRSACSCVGRVSPGALAPFSVEAPPGSIFCFLLTCGLLSGLHGLGELKQLWVLGNPQHQPRSPLKVVLLRK